LCGQRTSVRADWKTARALGRIASGSARSASSCKTTSRSASASDARGGAVARRKVPIQVGAGQRDDQRAFRISVAPGGDRRMAAPRVQRNQRERIGRVAFGLPPLRPLVQ
jgi:hypothetical protein